MFAKVSLICPTLSAALFALSLPASAAVPTSLDSDCACHISRAALSALPSASDASAASVSQSLVVSGRLCKRTSHGHRTLVASFSLQGTGELTWDGRTTLTYTGGEASIGQRLTFVPMPSRAGETRLGVELESSRLAGVSHFSAAADTDASDDAQVTDNDDASDDTTDDASTEQVTVDTATFALPSIETNTAGTIVVLHTGGKTTTRLGDFDVELVNTPTFSRP